MAPTARYDRIGRGYISRRQPDPRIEAQIWAAIGPATSIVNIGAGAGSYERDGSHLVAVEPSAVMIGQRPDTAAPAVQAGAERLPFSDHAFEVALALLTVHHWSDLELGLAEMRRVAMTIDPPVHDAIWLLQEYVPAIIGMSDNVPLDLVVRNLDAHTVDVIPIPVDCLDGFCMAYWNRPAEYLDPIARANTSAFARLDEADYAPGLARLERDLADGTWQLRHGNLLELTEYDVGLRLVVAG